MHVLFLGLVRDLVALIAALSRKNDLSQLYYLNNLIVKNEKIFALFFQKMFLSNWNAKFFEKIKKLSWIFPGLI